MSDSGGKRIARRINRERERYNEYQRRYRETHPAAVKKWRETYIIRKAARLIEQQQNADGEHDAGRGD